MEYLKMVLIGIAILATMIVVSMIVKIVTAAFSIPTMPICFDFTNVKISAIVGFGAVCIGFALYVFLVFIPSRIREGSEY